MNRVMFDIIWDMIKNFILIVCLENVLIDLNLILIIIINIVSIVFN